MTLCYIHRVYDWHWYWHPAGTQTGPIAACRWTSPGLITTVTHSSHWWHQEQHLAKISPIFQKKTSFCHFTVKITAYLSCWITECIWMQWLIWDTAEIKTGLESITIESLNLHSFLLNSLTHSILSIVRSALDTYNNVTTTRSNLKDSRNISDTYYFQDVDRHEQSLCETAGMRSIRPTSYLPA